MSSIGERFWASVLTGIPFGVFKLGMGFDVYHNASTALGAILMAWGAIDILLNVVAVFLPDRVSWCLLSNIGRAMDGRPHGRRETLFLAIDTLVSFMIVSGMLLLERLPLASPVLAWAWTLSVVANVLGVGVARVREALAAETPAPG